MNPYLPNQEKRMGTFISGAEDRLIDPREKGDEWPKRKKGSNPPMENGNSIKTSNHQRAEGPKS